MKLVRFGSKGGEKPGVIDRDGRIHDLSAHIPDVAGRVLEPATLDKLRNVSIDALPVVPSRTRLGPCVAGVGKIICIGLNYSDHAAESGMAVPPEPVIFFKATTSLCGPNDAVIIPRDGTKLDWEIELAVVIGRVARYVDTEHAPAYVAGYALHNDYSERAFQLERGGQWVKGKSADTFAPLGPFLATRDELPDISGLAMWLDVNGQPRQRGTTANMVVGVPALVSYVSQFMTLLPGDVISTGTPAGVGLGMTPPTYLQPGDEVTLGIDRLGQARQRVVESA